MIDIDIIILSYAKDENLKKLTQQTIDTLIASEDKNLINFNVLVIESEKSIEPYQYPGSKTIYPQEKFGFNRYLNIGIRTTYSDFVCMCNNDLIFHKNWATNILKSLSTDEKILSSNPICPNFTPTQKYLNYESPIFADSKNIFDGVLSGWCIFVKRKIFKIIGQLDENFSFWYADRDYGMTLLKYNLAHFLVPSSKVIHLGNQSHGSINDDQYDGMTDGQKVVYEDKWGKELKKLHLKKCFKRFLKKINLG